MRQILQMALVVLAMTVVNAQTTPPPGWTCSALRWGDGYCDCGNCGIYDPDCEEAISIRSSCRIGQYCRPDTNQCWKTLMPLEWTCSEFDYEDGFVCDCECGAQDPDCSDNSVDTIECHVTEGTARHATCTAEYMCEEFKLSSGVVIGIVVGSIVVGLCCLGGCAFLIIMAIKSIEKPSTPIAFQPPATGLQDEQKSIAPIQLGTQPFVPTVVPPQQQQQQQQPQPQVFAMPTHQV